MLKDKLNVLLVKKNCVVGEAFCKMDSDTQEAFCDVMKSDVGDKTISDALKSEGVMISREAIRGHRHCFAESTKEQCKCFPGGPK